MLHLCKRIEHQIISHYYKSLDVGFPLGFVNVIYNKDGNCLRNSSVYFFFILFILRSILSLFVFDVQFSS